MKRFSFFCILFIAGHIAFAQAWVHEILDASNGLPSSECLSVLQDHTGHLWVGTTAGISRYDGYSFENFSTTHDGVRIGKVNVIREDQQQLWIGSDAGLFFRTKEGVIAHVADAKLGASGINDLSVTPDYLFAAAEIGALKIPRSVISTDSVSAPQVDIAKYILPDWKRQPGMRLTHVALADDGTVYLSGIHAVFRYAHEKFTRLFETVESIDQIMTLIPIDSSLLYVYSSQENFHKVKGNVATVVDVRVEPRSPGEGKSIVVLRAMGLYEFDPLSETVTRVIDLSADGILWSTESILDDAGIYWIASHDGLVKLKRSYFNEVPFEHPSAYPEVYSISESKDGDLMLGSNRGIIFKREDGSIIRAKDVSQNAEVFDMFNDGEATWYATGYEGIVREKNGMTTPFTERDGLHNNSTHTFLETRDGKLFVMGDKGVSQISENESVSFKQFIFRSTQTQYATFYDGIEDDNGTVWFAGQEGLARLKADSLVLYALESRYLYIAGMKKDASDTVWLAVNGEGVWQCYFDGDQLKVNRKFTIQEGLSANVFTGLFVDKADNVWISHYQGISLIRNADKAVMNFDQTDGWPFRNYNNLKLYEDRAGMIWAGCSKGLAWFDPGELTRLRSIPRIFLNSYHGKKLHDASGFSIPYRDRKIVFRYHAIDFPEQNTLRYFYRLDGIQSDWLSAGVNREINFDQLPPGDYVFSVRARNNKGGESGIVSVAFTVERPFWQTTWFILIVVTLTALIVLLVIRLREQSIRKSEQQIKQREIQLLSLNRDLAKSRLVALRNQMNPHFIFNALNSIQQFVLQGNVDEANRYLSQFARLQRDILNSSDQDFIFLDQEIGMLTLYLQLEQLRSPNSFHFSITLGEGVDPDELKIPPMLIQPFVENSIWHGLKHRQGDKNVWVNFYLENDRILSCVVRDNGIGRKAAERIRTINGNAQQYPSRGLQLIGERMTMLRQQYNLPFEIVVDDVLDADGNVCGTTVKILLPIDH